MRPLFCYSDEEFGVSFYYAPASGIEQDFYRESYPEFDTPYVFLEEVFHEYVQLCEIKTGGGTEFIAWPDQDYRRQEYLDKIDKGHIIETGAAIMGWLREDQEDPEDFIDRIFGDIKDAVSAVRS